MTQNSSSDAPPIDRKWLQCNGQQLLKLAHAGMLWLDHNQEKVNALNVFPVPDGDTGTNMLLTMRSAYKQVQNSTTTNVGKMAGDLSYGALMGARGNSGVILSQIWRGLAKSLKGKETFNADDLADAFQQAANTAYGGVMKPVEGTILTVIRAGAEEAASAVLITKDLRFLLARVLERCEQALERTPELLPVLKQAGVVDSGGQGLVYIFEGMLRYAKGELPLEPVQATAVTVSAAPAQAFAVPEGGELENPYDVQFILMGQNLNVEEVRRRIDAMGDSTVVVGDETTIKVHIHVKNPGEPLSYGISLGRITDVVVENMQLQMEEIIGEQGTAVSGNGRAPQLTPVNVEPGQIGVIAVSPGSGLASIFQSLGVAYVVHGGQTNNPSTEEIFQAIQDVPTDKIIILPNNKNIFLASEAARDLSPKHVRVVATRTIPQGFNAMLHHNPDGDLDEIASAMAESIRQVATGEITRAIRSVTLDDVEVNEGEIIGLVNGRLCASGPDLPGVLAQVLVAMEMDERELLSLYYGHDVTEPEANEVVGQIQALYPDAEIEILPGGQAHYFYILGAE
ncbi:MAG: DAK2 domain-containing protein [Chloroflexi bacterium]|nr:DAK2 domain-containing protein [Chloroflexota bacterium]MBK6711428.1 DAK2 domain-containing protein [Chloroflexota bacterium]MBK7176714.1 DAK2 domain-containing protein [Chloroflexota bacterium]MBK7915691.1 DAK2 domain-containing protein [Chloroflexota bacterium]MBK8935244.1 DAK2 domain-containing protein [Chloroflexota bacterium]